MSSKRVATVRQRVSGRRRRLRLDDRDERLAASGSSPARASSASVASAPRLRARRARSRVRRRRRARRGSPAQSRLRAPTAPARLARSATTGSAAPPGREAGRRGPAVPAVAGSTERAVERRSGGVPERELGAGGEVGEVDEQVGALGRREHEALGGQRDRRAEEPALGADLGDPAVVGPAVAGEHEPVGAGVRAVEYAEPVRRRLDLDVRPDRAVDGGEGPKHSMTSGSVLCSSAPVSRPRRPVSKLRSASRSGSS